mmetsp:Transcript_15773/g.23217  ORF Transcript_15773/g.23217 Transcript_15773/m.23217 type:complete len:632 (+) Transcript_15773:88-1983(+)
MCAIWAEAVIMNEPSLRGLVHAGVMVLFAWICWDGDGVPLGFVFAGLGLLFLSILPLTTFISVLWLNSTTLDDASCILLLPINDSLMFFTIIGCALAAFFLLLFLSLQALNPIISQQQRRGERPGVIWSMLFFAVGSALSLGDSWIQKTNTCSFPPSQDHHLSTLVLDFMAYVFHRAFIGSLLVGGTRVMNDNDHPESSHSFSLHGPYRAYFSIIAINVGLSWIILGTGSSRQLISLGGLFALISGMVEVNHVAVFLQQQVLRRQAAPPSIPTSKALLSPPVLTGYKACVICFTFYAITLFVNGVILFHNEQGFDGCLVRAVHVAAVFAAMVSIFPRLLVAEVDSTDRTYNNYVKTFVAIPSTVDVGICVSLYLLLKRRGDLNHSTALSLLLRAAGAILQAWSYASLQVAPGTTDKSLYNSNEAQSIANKIALESDDGFMMPLVDKHVQEFRKNTAEASLSPLSAPNNTEVKGISILLWLLYWVAHVFHSFCGNGTNPSIIMTEIQLSKVFHFQVVTLGFHTSALNIHRSDNSSHHNVISMIPEMGLKVTAVFVILEACGILACTLGDQRKTSPVLSIDQLAILSASILVFVDVIRQFINLRRCFYNVIEQPTNEQMKMRQSPGSILFPYS